MSERSFTASDLERFLRAVDQQLTQPHEITLIGGAAAALAYGAGIANDDIDLFESDLDSLRPALQLARASTGLDIPVSGPSVAEIPYNSQDRCVRILPDLVRLEVWALEKHDLALSKISRGNGKDSLELVELHRVSPLEVDALVARYRTEMDHVTGDPGRLAWNFLMLIQRLFGSTTHDDVRQEIARKP